MAIVKRAYDTRVREIIARTGNANLFPELDIPRGTRATWVRRGPREIVGLDEELDSQATLLDRLAKLEHRVRVLTALLRLVLTMLRLSEFRVHMPRIPEGKNKQALLFAVAKARAVLPLAAVLKVLHVSASRYHAWVRSESECELMAAGWRRFTQPHTVSSTKSNEVAVTAGHNSAVSGCRSWLANGLESLIFRVGRVLVQYGGGRTRHLASVNSGRYSPILIPLSASS